jgi:TonB family protein
MDYLHQMGRFLLISLSLHLLFAYVTTFVNPARKVIPFPPVRVSLLDTEFEDNENLPSGTVIEIETDAEFKITNEPSEAKLLAASVSTGVMKKREFAQSGSVVKKKVQKKSSSVASIAPLLRKTDRVKEFSRIAIKDVDAMARENPAGYHDSGDEAVVSLNTKKFEYAEYFLSIKRGIEDNWYYPSVAVIDRLGGNTLVRFTLLPSGELESVAVISSSGESVLDDASTGALKLAEPFNPFPSKLKKRRIHIISNFSYQPSFSPVRSGR